MLMPMLTPVNHGYGLGLKVDSIVHWSDDAIKGKLFQKICQANKSRKLRRQEVAF